MSEGLSFNVNSVESNQIHFILDDQEFVLHEADINQDVSNIACTDGPRAFLVDGQYYITENPTILYQNGDFVSNELPQCYINENNDGFVLDTDDISVTNMFDKPEIVQLVPENGGNDGQIIFYTTNNMFTNSEAADMSVENENNSLQLCKRVKLGEEFDELLEDQSNIDEFCVQSNDRIQYILDESEPNDTEDALTEDDEPTSEQEAADQQDVLEKITGRNLITGETVTLHSYMEKLKKKLNTDNITALSENGGAPQRCRKTANDEGGESFADLLDKKIAIGKTRNGKRLVGRIIHVEKRGPPAEDEHFQTSPAEVVMEDREDHVEDEPRVIVKKWTVSNDSFEEISKTLGGIMEMESVRKKLENKNIVVKLIEKKYSNNDETCTKMMSYSYGYMEQEADGEEGGCWKFVPDQDTQSALLDGADSNKLAKFTTTTSLAIVVSYGLKNNGNKTIKVNLNPSQGNLCSICTQYFKNNFQLRLHMKNAHGLTNQPLCEVCGILFDDPEKLKEHRIVHVEEGKLFICSECNKCFMSQGRLQKHLPTHSLHLRPLECTACKVRCGSDWALKKHLLTHTGLKPFCCDICSKHFISHYDLNLHKKIHFPEKHFACEVCLRTFSRHSNLLRHMEIHKGSGTLYRCDICYCSYNYISSLTRHMVQHHIDAEEFKKKE